MKCQRHKIADCHSCAAEFYRACPANVCASCGHQIDDHRFFITPNIPAPAKCPA